MAADDVGKKFVDQQIVRALRSTDYLSILKKIGSLDPSSMSFRRRDLEETLIEPERKKLDNFLQKMKKLDVLRSGDAAGEYVFNVRMVRLYLWLETLESSETVESR